MKSVFTLAAFLFTIAISSAVPASAQAVNTNDSLALVALYNSTQGVSWINNTNWLTTNPVSTWYGITVTGNRVTTINLNTNFLVGTLPLALGNLTGLDTLILTWNNLKGGLPYTFAKCTALVYADLSRNQFSQKGNPKFPSYPVSSSFFNISYNQFTFDGLEFFAQKYPGSYYQPQEAIATHVNGNTLSVSAGGTLSNNTYTWFQTGKPGSTVITGDSTFHPRTSGSYYAHITNAVANQSFLISKTVKYVAPASAEKTATPAITASPVSLRFAVYPNPASDVIHIQTEGAATITLTNSNGKMLLSKQITNSDVINIKTYPGGTYYLQNKTTGCVKKIVITH